MSSLATGPRPAESGPAQATSSDPTRRRRFSADVVVGLALAGALVLLGFVTTGGSDLAPNTWSQIVLALVGAGLAATLLVVGAEGRRWGGVTVLLFAGLAALTFASIAWSVQPANSWLEANRTLSYLAAFGGAVVLARVAPGRWRALAGAIALFAIVLCGYALLVKVFPATFDRVDDIGRLGAPFGYYNATGVLAAMGMPVCLWAGARPEGGRLARVLSVPALALLLVVLILSYSRGSIVAAILALAVWFIFVPLRLRSALVLALGAIGGAIASGWALATSGITGNQMTLAVRTSAGHHFGVVLVLVIAVLTLVSFLSARTMERASLAPELRRRIGIALIVLVALVPVGCVVALAASSRGFTGELSHTWSTLTNPNGVVGNSPDRLAQLGSSRPRYWGEGLKVGEHHLLAGTGALGYATARTVYSSDSVVVVHAHSYVIETFADFGLIGIALSLALLTAWAIATRRTLGPRLVAVRDYAAEHDALVALLATVVAFGFSSLVDWTWFIPGVAVPALICAGWLAGRGPLSAPIGRRPQRRRLLASPGAGALAFALTAVVLGAAWVVWQPLRSADADNAAITAEVAGHTNAALKDARASVAQDPVDFYPLTELAAIYTALGDNGAARTELVKATTTQPSNPATWQQLGTFELQQGQPAAALRALNTGLRFDPTSPPIIKLIGEAKVRIARAGG